MIKNLINIVICDIKLVGLKIKSKYLDFRVWNGKRKLYNQLKKYNFSKEVTDRVFEQIMEKIS